MPQIANDIPAATAEPAIPLTGVITVRIPKSMHDKLRAAAYKARVTLNTLCAEHLAKLVGIEEQIEEWCEKRENARYEPKPRKESTPCPSN